MYNVYIASPFFNEEQLERVEYIKSQFDKHGISYYSPKDECLLQPDASIEMRRKVFYENCEAIVNSSIVFAVTDGKDMGTIWECGFAFANGIPIIYFAETLGNRPFNLMLAQSGEYVLKSREGFEDYNFWEMLDDVINGKITFRDFEGEIE